MPLDKDFASTTELAGLKMVPRDAVQTALYSSLSAQKMFFQKNRRALDNFGTIIAHAYSQISLQPP
jgi:hypothetical protein